MPVAMNCSVPPTRIFAGGFDTETAIDISVTGVVTVSETAEDVLEMYAEFPAKLAVSEYVPMARFEIITDALPLPSVIPVPRLVSCPPLGVS